MKHFNATALAVCCLALAACSGETTTENVYVTDTIYVTDVVYQTDTIVEETPAVTVTGEVAIMVGETGMLSATTANGTDSDYTWMSDTDAVATVDDSGEVTGVAVGTAIITATGVETGAMGTWGVHVYEEGGEVVKDVMVFVTGSLSVNMGGTIELAVETVNGEDVGYDWVSDNEDVATVDEMGVVTGIGAGEALITATGQDTAVAGSHGLVVLAKGTVIPYFEQWSGSGHADETSESFRHWDEDGEVQTSCAKCHSGAGYLDFLGEDGTEFGVVDNPAPIDTVVSCAVCHNATAIAMDSVVFPSGIEIAGLGKSARCMQCHQGRESTSSVNTTIMDAAVMDADTVMEGVGFKNVHYFAAGATLLGSETMGAYQYEGKAYDGRFTHEDGFTSCHECHNPHTLEVEAATCVSCHGEGEFDDYRMAGSLADYDGDGDTDEGIKHEIEGLEEALYAAVQAYAAEKTSAIVYGAAYPYFFVDTNENGEADEDETVYANGYKAFTPKLLKGAYNFQYAHKDPGAYAHNAKYLIAVLYDSIEDLGGDVSGLSRGDHGHFDGTSESWRHWDEDDSENIVSSSCAPCHSAALPKFNFSNNAKSGGSVPAADGLSCNVCHTGADYADGAPLNEVTSVDFPSGIEVSGSGSSFLCMQCHKGRQSTTSVNDYIADADPDDDDTVFTGSFRNVHYAVAGATRYGGQAKVGYQFEGKYYDGFFGHEDGYTGCTDCHGVHDFGVKEEACAACHEGDPEDYRMPGSTVDYDGDNDIEEGIKHEILDLEELLYAAIQDYATNVIGTGIFYSSHYPYFFIDANDNGVEDDGETDKYTEWTANLIRATFNYQYSHKDPGGFAHNPKYVIALLYDGIEAVGGDVSALGRNDHGHFDSTSEAFRHWDEDGAMSASCARCHSSEGAIQYFTTGEDVDEDGPLPDHLTCNVCHTGTQYVDGAPVRYVEKIVFPSGEEVMNDADNPDPSFVCAACHQGRQSMTSIQAAIDDNKPGFKNVHYLPAAAMLYGADSKIGYHYDGKTYAGAFGHFDAASKQCTYCHDASGEKHSFEPVLAGKCVGCHSEAAGDMMKVRKNRTTDYDGDMDTDEPLNDELMVLADALYLEIQAVASAGGTGILYSASSYPYFFKDTNDNGMIDDGEVTYSNSYKSWTNELMIAAHHFQMFQKEHGAWAHNTDYMAQLLFDSIEALGGNVSSFNRP
jgi:hypothetical protein